jgi:hypothetical protein
MKKSIFTLLMAGLCSISYGQSDIDALRYSQNSIGSTARSKAVGGAFGALGGDLSSVQINPAGLAIYRSNAFIISGAMTNTKSKATYLDNTKRDYDFGLGLPSIGLVFNNTKYVKRKPATKGWVSTNFVMSVNQTNSFNGIVNYNGDNADNSMLDYFAERANGLTVGDLAATEDEITYGYGDLETMAWEGYLIDSVGHRTYAAAIDNSQRNINQRNIISTRGATHDISLSLASNYEHKFYIGGGITLSTVRYREENRFTETDLSADYSNWAGWTLERNLLTKGVGISGNLGVIAKPNKNVRVGASIKTPTIYYLTDEYSDDLTVNFDDGAYGEYESAEGYFDYKVLSPLKTTLSAAYLFGKQGFLSTDVEFVDYAMMRLRPTISAFESVNDLIGEKYGNAVNLRVGGEYVINSIRLRGGYARFNSPLSNGTDNNLTRTYITGGIGIKENNWALDLAVTQRLSSEVIQPYTLDASAVPYATNKGKRNALELTLTTKF